MAIFSGIPAGFFILIALAPNKVWMMIFHFFSALFITALFPSCSRSLATTYASHAQQQTAVFSLLGAASRGGSLLGSFVLAALIKWGGMDWRNAIVVSQFPGLFASTCMLVGCIYACRPSDEFKASHKRWRHQKNNMNDHKNQRRSDHGGSDRSRSSCDDRNDETDSTTTTTTTNNNNNNLEERRKRRAGFNSGTPRSPTHGAADLMAGHEVIDERCCSMIKHHFSFVIFLLSQPIFRLALVCNCACKMAQHMQAFVTLVAKDGLHVPARDASMFAIVFPSGSLVGTLILARLYERVNGKRQGMILLLLALLMVGAALVAAGAIQKAGKVAQEALKTSVIYKSHSLERDHNRSSGASYQKDHYQNTTGAMMDNKDTTTYDDTVGKIEWAAVRASGVPWNISIAIFLIAMTVSIPYYVEVTQIFPSEYGRDLVLPHGGEGRRRRRGGGGGRRRGGGGRRGGGEGSYIARTQSVMDGLAYSWNFVWTSLVIPFLLGPDEGGNPTHPREGGGGGGGGGGGNENMLAHGGTDVSRHNYHRNGSNSSTILHPYVSKMNGWVVVFILLALLWLPIGWLLQRLVLWREERRNSRRRRKRELQNNIDGEGERLGGTSRNGKDCRRHHHQPLSASTAAGAVMAGEEGEEEQEPEAEDVGLTGREIEMRRLLDVKGGR